MHYKHIMLAVGLDMNASSLVHKAQEIAVANSAKLSIIHVDRDIASFYDGILSVDLNEHEEAKHHSSVAMMRKLLDNLSTPIYKHLLYTGTIEDEIYRGVIENDVDLLIMGHHRSDMLNQIFLYPTDPLVKEMPCDLLFLKP
ncbi:universal stress protein [Photobacterium profundum]|uniref:Universal stress protein n=1 Tax=Photobacterium profundum 3TCK TaxID=314280 RepID=Q1ZAI3_9GAMM|nr:universal stress protein [Photobacterium profundum]EAS45509.1 hypothetical universal stress protein A [Photobacterium profundum 3TCK]PSV63313.1 universal stress protein [Photobacterium profundum]